MRILSRQIRQVKDRDRQTELVCSKYVKQKILRCRPTYDIIEGNRKAWTETCSIYTADTHTNTPLSAAPKTWGEGQRDKGVGGVWGRVEGQSWLPAGCHSYRQVAMVSLSVEKRALTSFALICVCAGVGGVGQGYGAFILWWNSSVSHVFSSLGPLI